jgi:hypothetical protein
LGFAWLVICLAVFQVRAGNRDFVSTPAKVGEIPVIVLKKSNQEPPPIIDPASPSAA